MRSVAFASIPSARPHTTSPKHIACHCVLPKKMGAGARSQATVRGVLEGQQPDGSETIRYTHAVPAEQPLLAFFQLFAALFFSSYFFFWIFGLVGLYLSMRWALLSMSGAALLLGVYVAQIMLYKPHKGKGWHFEWFLYSRLVDLVLGYHGGTCVREGPAPDPRRRLLFAMAPHGVFGVCRAFSGGTAWRKLYPKITARWGSFGGAFVLPGVREFSLCCGCLDASRSVLTRAIERGENVILLPGGEKEMMLTDGESTETQLVLGDRKGFVRLAVTHGMDLVPGFCFGEKWVHHAVRLPKPLRAFLYRHLRIAGVVLTGRWGCTFLGEIEKADGSPLRLGYVWGTPIRVEQRTEPSEEYIDEVHAKFVAAMKDIFERRKREFGYGDEEKLVIVSAKKSV